MMNDSAIVVGEWGGHMKGNDGGATDEFGSQKSCIQYTKKHFFFVNQITSGFVDACVRGLFSSNRCHRPILLNITIKNNSALVSKPHGCSETTVGNPDSGSLSFLSWIFDKRKHEFVYHENEPFKCTWGTGDSTTDFDAWVKRSVFSLTTF